ncbi:hypothetical protein PACTADRAFT_50329 [Pachysolen tannophilus NRRL Y-2460]|uniref:CNH domain-containing protein n=1 Tax=Pachysolen tannophilus NRRL Y-2460 TaxID=669874 RepID=A0A1E4TV16_PACTA|nr:hypothetical protein PACTADRAFT_50329 [Pachysolen tannophilus NRRL Y-2460]
MAKRQKSKNRKNSKNGEVDVAGNNNHSDNNEDYAAGGNSKGNTQVENESIDSNNEESAETAKLPDNCTEETKESLSSDLSNNEVKESVPQDVIQENANENSPDDLNSNSNLELLPEMNHKETAEALEGVAEMEEEKEEKQQKGEIKVNNNNLDEKDVNTETDETSQNQDCKETAENSEAGVSSQKDFSENDNKEFDGKTDPVEDPKDNENKNLKLKEIHHDPIISSGPYSLVSLINSIPVENSEIPESQNAQVTSIESFDSNIYIGTSVGELLHYFKIDDEIGYMLISRQRFSETKTRQIKKIVLLPSISRALVLSGSILSCFMLPELSPANIGKIKDVNDISLDWDSFKLDLRNSNKIAEYDQTHGIVATLLTKKCIRLVRVASDSIKLIKDLNYPNSIAGIRRSNYAAAATQFGYDLVDMIRGQKIPLFPISTSFNKTENDDVSTSKKLALKPLIFPVGKREFLLSCGNTKEEPSMGMIVNTNGDISRGTIPWSSYPSSLIVDYPYAIAVLNSGNEVVIHSIHDQAQAQQITCDDKVKVSSVSHIFNFANDKIIELIRLSVLANNGDIKDYELKEKISDFDAKISKISNISSSSLLYGVKEGVKLFLPTPKLVRLVDLADKNANNTESVIEDLQDEIRISDNSTDYGKVESDFITLLIGLILVGDLQFDRAFDYWIDGNLDPRVLIFIFTKNIKYIYGGLLTFSSLAEKIRNVRTKIQAILNDEISDSGLKSKKSAVNEFYKLFLNGWMNKRSIFKGEDGHVIFKTLEVSLVLEYLSDNSFTNVHAINNFTDLIKEYVLIMKDETVNILLENKKFYVACKYYEHLGQASNSVNLFMKLLENEIQDDDFEIFFQRNDELKLENLIEFIVNNFDDEQSIWKYGEWLVTKHPKYAVKLFASSQLKCNINEHKVLTLLDKISEDSGGLKLSYLQVLVVEKSEIQFIGDLIIEILNKMLKLLDQDKNLQESLELLISKYRILKIPKSTFDKYWKIESLKTIKNNEFVKLHNNLCNFISIISRESKIITNKNENKNVLKTCESKLKINNNLPYLLILIIFKLGSYESCIDQLCQLTDFKSAETLAMTFKIPIEFVNFDHKIDHFIQEHNHPRNKLNFTQNKDKLIVPEEEVVEVVVEEEEEEETGNGVLTKDDSELNEKLLLQVFEHYLSLNDFNLIENFLNNHKIFKFNEHQEQNIDELFKKFEIILNKIPNNFPIFLINMFLSKNLIKINDNLNNSLMIKNLTRSENKRLKKIYKDIENSGNYYHANKPN